MERLPIPALLAHLALLYPKLVLMRGRQYFRIEDLSARSKRDATSGGTEAKSVLAEPIYWYETDPHGKIVVSGARDQGGTFVSFVEAGSDVKTAWD